MKFSSTKPVKAPMMAKPTKPVTAGTLSASSAARIRMKASKIVGGGK